MKKPIEALPCSVVFVSHIPHLVQTLVACLALMFAERATAAEFTTLYNFTNATGASPLASLTSSSNILYGTTSGGGIGGYGTVFAVKTDGTGFTNLYRFTGGNDGYRPSSGLVFSSNVLYGTAYYGGTNGNGTVFAVNAGSGAFTNLYSFSALNNFTNGDGANPYSGLILSGRTLFGTTYKGGNTRNGTVFAINTDGTGFTNLHTFNKTGTDGDQLYAGLTLAGGTLYGTTSQGGTGIGGGTVFSLTTNGTAFTVLYNFGTNYSVGGQNPYAGLVLSSNILYGTAQGGGSGGLGTVFAINTNGTGFKVLHNFVTADGANVWGTLVLSGNTLFGTGQAGGSNSVGTVYAVTTDGLSFTNLHNFSFASGSEPEAGLALSGHALYGTAYTGGSGNFGTVFSLSSTPQLALTPASGKLVVSWPTNSAGFDYSGYILQSAPGLGTTFTNIPGATSPYTNTLNSPVQFFRLFSN